MLDTKETTELYWIMRFLTAEFTKGNFSLDLLEEVLNTKKSLDEKDYLEFKRNPTERKLSESEQKDPDFVQFKEMLGKLEKLMKTPTHTVERLHDILFKGDNFTWRERGKR